MIKYKGLSTLEVLKEAKNYNKWISDEIKKYITTPTLEIGAGTGNISSQFLQKSPLHLSDNDAGLVKNLKKKFANHKHVAVHTIDVEKKPKEKFLNYFTTIFAINVLEHIKDDTTALHTMRSMLKKSGKLVLLVPAKKRAFTKLDKDLGHFRRYEKEELVKKMRKAGYRIEQIYFFNFVGLISWYIRDKVYKETIHLQPYHVALFDKLVPLLRAIETIIRPPIGISLIVVGTRIK
ncbi:MAG TPA: class I SAM-dependent methyltransferase [Patescibacteria group bacterium]|nr:class I SAM-dependent methyltransferase [Patescibacteria group bacterium]